MIKRPRLTSNTSIVATVVASLSIFSTACSFQQYSPQAIDAAAITARIERKDPAGEHFHQYLISNGYTVDRLPIRQWDLDALTYCALFFNPRLDIARAQWRAAEVAELAAAEKIAPVANGHFAHSDRANGDISPFAFGLSIDIPIETANKRDIRIENAHHLSQVAKLEIAQTAWQLRSEVAQSLHAYQFNQQQIKLLTEEEARRQEIVSLYQKRVSLGAASNIELSIAKLQLQTTASDLNALLQKKTVLLATQASNLGLPLPKVEAMNLFSDAVGEPFDQSSQPYQAIPADLQATALINHLDIRIALERYAAAEAKLKLEIAKQYPNLVISPGYAYEFGDRIWSLGLSGLLTFLNKNKVAIAGARQLREVEAAQFEALQTKIISEVNIANAEIMQAKQILENQKKLYVQQRLNTQRMERKFAAGEIDRLELAFAKLEDIVAKKNVASAHYQLKTALNQLENTLQQPLIKPTLTTPGKSGFEDVRFKKMAN